MKKSNNEVATASRFLASTLHEIRTPIQTIISTVELLEDTNLDKEQLEYIRQIQFSADVLLDLANNILDFTKISSNEFKLESVPFDIITLTEQVVDLISIEAFNRGVEIVTDISYDMPQMVSGDPVRVQQIILNLIKNAVKFTNQGYIHVELLPKDNGIYFQVTDSGVGIPESKREKLFTDYYQADISTYRKFGGTGLGLSISKNLVSVMKGKIGVKSNPYGGSVFFFWLPLSKVETPAFSDKPVIPEGQRILIVDDNELSVRSLTNKLHFLGIDNITTTNTAEDAMNQLVFAERVHDPFTMAFVDMILPVVDGWHFASEVKNNPELNNKPKLYLLVPEGQMKSEAKMKTLNWYNGYLYKPFKKDKLYDLFNEAFSKTVGELETLDSPKEIKMEPEKKSDDSLIAKGHKILIAEDHPVNRKLLETFLKKFGADIYLAEDGEQAVKVCQEIPDIDLIFMDIYMPVMNGIESTVALRKMNFGGIIIACTANNDEGDFESYRKIGINDILVKPFKSSAIKACLEKWETVMQFPEVQQMAILESTNSVPGEIWDQNDFLDTTAGDTELASRMTDAFIIQTEGLLETAEKLFKSSDYAELAKIGHALKGSSATLSAKSLSEYGKRLEKAARNKDAGEVELNLTFFTQDFGRFKKIKPKWKN